MSSKVVQTERNFVGKLVRMVRGENPYYRAVTLDGIAETHGRQMASEVMVAVVKLEQMDPKLMKQLARMVEKDGPYYGNLVLEAISDAYHPAVAGEIHDVVVDAAEAAQSEREAARKIQKRAALPR